jgi:hypothetical protein
MEILDCPTCGAPAEVEAASTMASTGGPMGHVRVRCVRRHWLLMPRELLDSACSARVAPAASVQGQSLDRRRPT